MEKITAKFLLTLLFAGMGCSYGYGQMAATDTQSEQAPAYAKQNWALAVMEKGNDRPAVKMYYSLAETASNGVEYNRVYDGVYPEFYFWNPDPSQLVKLQYGYRWADRQMFIYDFESQKETLAFDFNLSAGDHFTTFNGMEWLVESVKDTLVNISFCGTGAPVTKRLLTVKTPDGSWHDQWLEDFGSFTNFFMLSDLDDVVCSQALWLEYSLGEYLAREISADPIYTHDSGWLEGTGNPEPKLTPHSACKYSNGVLTFENVQWFYPHRDYTCFYRDGDRIEQLYGWELQPHVDQGSASLCSDAFTFSGLPEPLSGQYTIRFGNTDYTTGIRDVRTSSSHSGYTYDLQGRRTEPTATVGIQIRDGKKVLVR